MTRMTELRRLIWTLENQQIIIETTFNVIEGGGNFHRWIEDGLKVSARARGLLSRSRERNQNGKSGQMKCQRI